MIQIGYKSLTEMVMIRQIRAILLFLSLNINAFGTISCSFRRLAFRARVLSVNAHFRTKECWLVLH